MRTRQEILSDGRKVDQLILEVLLDIREQVKKPKQKRNMNKNKKGVN
jgi:hypothetical protein